MSLFDNWQAAFHEVMDDPVVAAPLKAASLAEDLKLWTTCLKSAVVLSCKALHWTAAAKGHLLTESPKPGQEYLNIDVMAFEPRPETVRWALPTAVFELENARTDTRIAYSLWKVLCVRARLRVVFAFRRDWESSRNTSMPFVKTSLAVCPSPTGWKSTARRCW